MVFAFCGGDCGGEKEVAGVVVADDVLGGRDIVVLAVVVRVVVDGA